MFNEGMQYRAMGRSGLKLSALGLGGWTTYGASVKAEDTVRSIITHAYEQGINFFDISDIYEKGEAEKAMGKVFASGVHRREVDLSCRNGAVRGRESYRCRLRLNDSTISTACDPAF